MPIDEITLRINVTPEFNELCEIHLQMAKLLKREAILMGKIRIASMAGTQKP